VPHSRDRTARRDQGRARDHQGEYVSFEPEEFEALEQASSLAVVIDSFVPEGAIDPVYFEDTYYLGAGKKGERGCRVLAQGLQRTDRIAIGTLTWHGKTTPIAIRVHQDGLLLQRLAYEVYS
jgi:DNA end-binding protein Ku